MITPMAAPTPSPAANTANSRPRSGSRGNVWEIIPYIAGFVMLTDSPDRARSKNNTGKTFR